MVPILVGYSDGIDSLTSAYVTLELSIRIMPSDLWLEGPA